jgi:uncharacterized protein (TIGR02284 family)
MKPSNLETTTLASIQRLIEDNFTGRDELHAAAGSLDDESRARACRRLAEHLTANAIELQQIVKANGEAPAADRDMGAISQALFDLAKLNRGESAVLAAAAEGERSLKNDYDLAIEAIVDPEAIAVLQRHRAEVKCGEEMLRDMESLTKNYAMRSKTQAVRTRCQPAA